MFFCRPFTWKCSAPLAEPTLGQHIHLGLQTILFWFSQSSSLRVSFLLLVDIFRMLEEVFDFFFFFFLIELNQKDIQASIAFSQAQTLSVFFLF